MENNILVESYKKFWKNGLNFQGRTSRSDFWYVILDHVIIGFVLGFLSGLLGEGLGSFLSTIMGLYSLACIIPNIALEIRRLHDVNKSGWYLLMAFIPIVGWIFVLIAYCSQSVNDNNKYGEQI